MEGIKFVVSKDGSKRGAVRGYRRCSMSGCSGLQLIVRWEDGKRTCPCTKGMHQVAQDTMQIG